ncbi:UNVERIFIED_CONTAM: hypothetical protein GTU68_063836, partial [Idotea baltica]|nr:hypothetical protein [Idotea baltica]
MKIFDIKWSVGIACHAAIRSTDHLTDIISDCSVKNESLHDIKLHRSKVTSILNNVVHPCLHESIIEDIRVTPFSLIIDESTDVSVIKHMCLCVKYFKKDSASLITTFLSLMPVVSTTASSLFNDIKSYFDEVNVPLSNIIGLGTDGASNLCGCNNSVYTRLKEYSPNCVL